VYLTATENGETLHQHIFLCLWNYSQPARELWKGVTVHDQTCPWVHWFRRRTFSATQNFDLNNKNSTVTKLGTCKVNVLRHLKVKYYIVQVFIFEYNLSIKLETRSFQEIFLYERFSLFWCQEPTLEGCSSTSDTPVHGSRVNSNNDDIPTQH
jgi:hypothetical protein